MKRERPEDAIVVGMVKDVPFADVLPVLLCFLVCVWSHDPR